jgi:hypothetical protein
MAEATRPTTALEVWSAGDIKQYGLGMAEYEALRKTLAAEATPAEFRAHLMVVHRLGLSPVGGMAHFVKRLGRWTTQIGIDGYRALAEDTKLYLGPVKGYPKWQYEEGGEFTEQLLPSKIPVAAKMAIWRKGWKDPVEFTAAYSQYVQTDYDGKITVRWQKAPHPQLAKCAEAGAQRLAFPRKLGGIYTIEESGAMEDVSVPPDHTPGVEKTADGFTVEQEAELKALSAKLPPAGSLKDYKGPTRWTLAKFRAEAKRFGGDFDKVKGELERLVAEFIQWVPDEPKTDAAATPETTGPDQAGGTTTQGAAAPVTATVDGKPVQGELVT